MAMKRFLLFLVSVAACLTSCQKELVTLKLELEAYSSADSKLHVENLYSCWDNNDTVMINGDEYLVTLSGNNALIADVAAASTYCAVYPASMVESGSGNMYVLNLPTIQRYRTNAAGQQVVESLMAGVSSGNAPLKFHNIGNLLKISFSSPTSTHLRKIKLQGEDAALSGQGYLALPSEESMNFIMSGGGDCCDSIVLDCGMGVPVEADTPKDFYISIPASLSNVRLTITVDDDYQTYSRTLSQPLSTARNKIYSLAFSTARDGVSATPHTKPLPNQIFCQFDNSQPYSFDHLLEVFGENTVIREFNGSTIITLPHALVDLPDEAFGSASVLQGNHALVGVTLPDGLRTIGDNAFCACWSLANINFPSTLTSIGEDAFHGCNIQSAILPDGLTTIKKNAFSVCNHLRMVSIPYGVTRIEEGTFASTSLDSVSLPNSVAYIGREAFYTCTHLIKIKLSESLIEIGESAFSTYPGFSDHHFDVVDIPSSVTKIGANAFSGCHDLETVNMHPATAPEIGSNVFPSQLQTIYIPQTNTGYDQGAYWPLYSSIISEGNF